MYIRNYKIKTITGLIAFIVIAFIAYLISSDIDDCKINPTLLCDRSYILIFLLLCYTIYFSTQFIRNFTSIGFDNYKIPPKNKPIGSEIKSCRTFLNSEIKSMSNMQVIIALGVTAHSSLLACLKLSLKDNAFKHSVIHKVSNGNQSFKLVDSYHCSRYNINTKRLSVQMFENVFELTTKLLNSNE